MQFIKETAVVCSAAVLAVTSSSIPKVSTDSASSIIINEICAKNTAYAAPDGKYYDWIELYNPSDKSADLSGYGLSDKADKPYQFVFPDNTIIAGKERIIVFCDSKIVQSNVQYSAAFGLSTNGETVLLTDSKGNTVDSITFGVMTDNQSYGRVPDGSESFAYMEMSPNTANEAKSIISADVKKPVLSKESGFYNDAFSLDISASENSVIYYTLDGSEPTADSSIYSSPIMVSDISYSSNILSARTDIAPSTSMSSVAAPKNPVDKAFVVRAAAMDENGNFSDTVTGTYFIGYQNKSAYYQNLKVISLVTDSGNLYDYENGIYVQGKVYEDWKNSPDYSLETPEWLIPGNYTQKGSAWEREASMQIFENGSLAVSQNVGIRIHGGATRSMPQKSFNIYARSRYGASKLNFDLFSGNVSSESSGETITEFDSFMLRNGGNDAQYARFRDKLNQSLVSDRSFLTQGMEPCIVFINGEYWGQYEITEKLDEDFISAHYGVKKNNICVVKNQELDSGDAAAYEEWGQLREWITSTDLSDESNYNELCEKIDMQSFMDYMSAEIYFNNVDWGSNNTAMWKAVNTDPSNPYADGKWRFVMFDTEYSTNLYGQAKPSDNTFSQIMQSDSFLADLLNSAMKNDTFNRQFCQTFMDMANENFNYNKVSDLIEQLSAAYHDTTVDTYNRFWSDWPGGYWAEPMLSKEVDSVKKFYSSRFSSITSSLKNSLGLNGQLVNVTVKNDESMGNVTINTIAPDFTNGSWSGKYYTNYPVSLSAEPKEGFEFVGWETSDGENIKASAAEIFFDSDITIMAVYKKSEKLLGDVNLDGEVNVADAVMLQKWLLCAGDLICWENGDLCKDEQINVFDLCLLKRMIIEQK